MNETAGWRGEDWLGTGIVALLGGAAFMFRWEFIVPRLTVGLCAATSGAPGFCTPRHWVLQGQYYGVFGWLALALGLWAFRAGRRGLAVAALAAGVVAVVNYDATLGIVGAALGLTAWGSVVSGRWTKA